MKINEILDNYLKYFFHMDTFNLLVFYRCWFLLASFFNHYKYLCETMYPYSFICDIPFYVTSALFFRSDTYRLPWDYTYNIPCLTVIPPYFSLKNA